MHTLSKFTGLDVLAWKVDISPKIIAASYGKIPVGYANIFNSDIKW